MKNRIWLKIPVIEDSLVAYNLKDAFRLMAKPYYKRFVNSLINQSILNTPGFVYFRCKSKIKNEKLIKACFEKLSSLMGDINNSSSKLDLVDSPLQNYRNSKIPAKTPDHIAKMHTEYTSDGHAPAIIGVCCIQSSAEALELILSNGANYFADTLLTAPERIKVLERNYMHDFVKPAVERNAELMKLVYYPIITRSHDTFLIRYKRERIEQVIIEGGLPFDFDAEEAMNHFDEYLKQKDMQLKFRLKIGDMIFFSNTFLLHDLASRHDATGHQPELLRAWIDR